jgi:glucosyl-3-phosphoglycerate synthase
VARAAGATVLTAAEVLPAYGNVPGKGEALWKGLAATTGEYVVFLDADLYDVTPGYVVGLLGPLLTDPAVDFVKAAYHRTSFDDSDDSGGRVTELLARPLLNLHWPQLAGFVQPLAGEYAGRRSVLERVPFVSGYGVELAMLVDLQDLLGLDALAQTGLGPRRHRSQDLAALGRMAAQIQLAAHSRLLPESRLPGSGAPRQRLTQFRRGNGCFQPVAADVSITQRPPLATVPEYRRLHHISPCGSRDRRR